VQRPCGDSGCFFLFPHQQTYGSRRGELTASNQQLTTVELAKLIEIADFLECGGFLTNVLLLTPNILSFASPSIGIFLENGTSY